MFVNTGEIKTNRHAEEHGNNEKRTKAIRMKRNGRAMKKKTMYHVISL